jgi:hypothetical protein
MHKLEIRRGGKVSEAKTDDRGKARTLWRRKGEGKSALQGPATEEKHALSRDKKRRKSERGKDWQQRKSMHFLETRRGGKVSQARTGDRGKATLPRDKKGRESE